MRVLTDGRVRRTESEWRSILGRYERSGLSESAFCRESKLSRSTFMKWKRRLAGTAGPAPAFVEWIAPSEVAEEAPARGGEFELRLPGGVVLRWRA
jgi:transposase